MNKYFPTFFRFFTINILTSLIRLALLALILVSFFSMKQQDAALTDKVFILNSKVNMYTEELRMQRHAILSIIQALEQVDARVKSRE